MVLLEFPHTSLFTPTQKVTVFGPELLIMLNGMWDTMIDANGIGLAANQVGIPYSFFVMKGIEEEKLFVINPRIHKRSSMTSNLKEGCLSAKGVFFKLKERSRWIDVRYQNEKGEEQLRLFTGIQSVCFQHESDHLLGKSFLQSKSIPKAEREELEKKWGLK
jgi:peptide deformylase